MATAVKDPITQKKNALQRKFNSLKRRIVKQFDKKFYLGDIPITDEEYHLLLQHTRLVIRSMERSKRAYMDRPLFCVALVQIGIRNYDGSYWPKLDEELKFATNQRQRQMISDTFLNTLKVHKKYILDAGGCVQTILLHGFVSNYYSKGLFELLFQYYSKDLERNIYRNTSEQMQALMDTLAKRAEEDESTSDTFMQQFMDVGSRAYKLRSHTLQAIRVQPSHSRARLRRLLRLIDQAFWKDQVPKNPVSRLTILFKEWIQDSPAYRDEYKLYQLGEIRNRGKKHFSMPYLYADILEGSFHLKFPSQIVPENYADDIHWEITTNIRSFILQVDTYPALTGYKTEERQCKILEEELFGQIQCKLVCNEVQVRRFADIPQNDVRFFDMEGDYAARLFKIPMCAYTTSQNEIQSSAMIDKVSFGNLNRWDFEFQSGDLVVLPDGTGMIAGDRYVDGFIPRGRVEEAEFRGGNEKIVPVYAALPELLLTLPEHKIAGTVLYVDEQRYALRECNIREFDTKDAKGMRAVVLPMNQFYGCQADGCHRAVLDIPGSNYAQEYAFLYVKGLKLEFDGAPYIFEERGTVVFPEFIHVESEYEKLQGENGFQFELRGDTPELNISVNHIDLSIKIPMLSWSTDRIHWNVAAMGEIWHADFFHVKKLYFRGPFHKISLTTDTDITEEDDYDDHLLKSEPAGEYLCVDMTRFRSWLTRQTMRNEITLRAGKEDFSFAVVYTRSLLASFNVDADYEASVLTCSCDIIGKADYYMDIVHLESQCQIADKVPVADGKVEIQDKLKSGNYQFTVYEAEEDDSGFEDILYEQLYTDKRQLINRNDFSGQILEIRKFKLAQGSNLYTEFNKEYLVTDLQKIDKNTYTGTFLVDREVSNLKLEITFPSLKDVRFFNVTFWHEEEEINVAFLYDRNLGELVKDELDGLRASERYRRYRELDEWNYIYFGLLHDKLPPAKKFGYQNLRMQSSNSACQENIEIEDMKFSARSYNALKRAGINTTRDIERKSLQDLYRIRNLAQENVNEVLEKIAQYHLHLMEEE